MKGAINGNLDITSPDYGTVTAVEWFFGYGGNALGLKRAIPGLRSVAVCERDAFVVANMVAKMEARLLDSVPIWTDVTDFPTEPFGYQQLDLFVASYPCQGFSHAGKRLGVEDHRHLWPYCRKFIGSVRPGWVWLENVEGHVSLGLSTVLADLEEDGYTAAWGIFSASEVGAPHQRKRVFILAYDKEQRLEGHGCSSSEFQRGKAVGAEILNRTALSSGTKPDELALRDSIGRPHGEPEIQSAEAGVDALGNAGTGGGEDVPHVVNKGLQGHAGDVNGEGREPGGPDRPTPPESLCGNVWPSRPGASQYGWEPPRVVDDANSRGLPKQGVCTEQPGRTETVRAGEIYDSDGGDGGQEPRSDVRPIPQGDEQGNGNSERQTQSPMGGNADGPADGMDFPGCTGLSDTELAEIREWMVKGTNRTDELRMCGNGVVPATAYRAFQVLYAELRGYAGTGDVMVNDKQGKEGR